MRIKINIYFIIFSLFLSLNLIGSELTFLTVDWPPYFSEGQSEQGPLSNIVKEIFKKNKTEVKIKFLPWKRALKLVTDGEADAVLGCYNAKKRRENYIISSSILESGFHFLVEKGSKFSKMKNLKIEQTKGKRFGIVRSYKPDDVFERYKENYEKHEVDKINQLFKLIKRGRIDIILEDPLVARYEFDRDKDQKGNKFNLISIGKVNFSKIKQSTLHLCWSKKRAKQNKNNIIFFEKEVLNFKKTKKYIEIKNRFGID